MKMEPVELSNHLVHAASAHWRLLMAQSSPLFSGCEAEFHSSLHNQNSPGKTFRFHRGVFPPNLMLLPGVFPPSLACLVLVSQGSLNR